jgi:hypothetical protein
MIIFDFIIPTLSIYTKGKWNVDKMDDGTDVIDIDVSVEELKHLKDEIERKLLYYHQND